MDILMACAELVPVAKVGGLADVVSALAKTLCRLEHKVTVALPRYPSVEQSGLMVARRLTPLRMKLGQEQVEATLFDARLGAGVEVLFIDLPGLFDRPGVYGEAGEDYPDNGRRFGLFCRALAEFVDKRQQAGSPFDVVHAHDWPTALLPYFLRDRDVRTVLTVHNAAFQGQFAASELDSLGLSGEELRSDELSHHSKVSFLKAGICSANVVNTVSPRYASELCAPAGGAGLDQVFSARDELPGILNGVDYAVWSPSTDQHLVARYDAEDVTNKGRCKASLLNELELSIDPQRPLLVSLGRVDEQKGSDLLARAVADIVGTDAQLLIAGDGRPELVATVEDSVARFSQDALYLGRVSEAMSHRLLAAADGVLLPSRFEPCGLVQQYAQRYGAAPIAHAVGGLRDTIVDCDAQLETGTGFLFDEPTSEALVGAVQRAVAAMRSPRWGALRRRMMRLDLSWERSARRYARHYRG